MNYQDLTQQEKNENFRYAIMQEDLKKAEELLLSGADINNTSDKGYSSLFLAAFNNKKRAFAYLLNRGANVNIQDNNNETVLMHLIRQDFQSFIDYLLKTSGNQINFELKDQLDRTSLILACIYKDSSTIEKMLKINPNINIHAKTEQNSTPLLISSSNYDLKSIKLLLNNGANINDVDFYEKNSLINAIMNITKESKKETDPTKKEEESKDSKNIEEEMKGDYLETIKLLVESGIDVNYKAKSGMSALFAACYYDKTGLAAQYLLDKGADPKILHSQMLTSKISPLSVAFETGQVQLANKILSMLTEEEKQDWMNRKNSEGNSPAAFAFIHKKTRQLAIDNFADPNVVINLPDQKFPLLAYIINNADSETFLKMVTAGAKLTYKDNKEFELFEPLKLAIAAASPTMIEKIIKYPGIDLNESLKISKEFSTTPLSFLMTNSQSKMLETINAQKRAAESILNQKLGDGSNAYKLPEETRNGIKEELKKLNDVVEKLTENRLLMIDLLLSNGAKINQQDENGRTALFYITEPEYIDIMIKKGADFFIQDNDGNNPLSFAIKNNLPIAKKWLEYVIENNLAGHTQIQNLLIDIMYTASNQYLSQNNLIKGIVNSISNGSSLLDKQDENGNTPVIIASALKQAPVLAVLVDLGADVNISNKLGETALMHAIARKDVDATKFLISKGADVKAKTKKKKTVLDFANEVGDKEILAEVLNKIDPTANVSSGKMKIN